MLTTLRELDLYDNQIERIEGLHTLTNLVYVPDAPSSGRARARAGVGALMRRGGGSMLDLSFCGIREIAHLDALVNLRELYLVQNKITAIKGLESLAQLTMLELGANRIRVRVHVVVRRAQRRRLTRAAARWWRRKSRD